MQPNHRKITSTIQYHHSTLAYHRWGTGSRLAICLHGYGESGVYFAFLSRQPALQHYTFIAIDLPWHGDTGWHEGLDFSTTELHELFQRIVQQEGLTDSWQQGIDLVGFSLGGRLALDYFQRHPALVHKMVLLAPDGLKVNGWYWFSTQTWLGSRFFRFTMRYPKWFFLLLKMANGLGLVNSSVFKFVNYYIGDEAARKLLFERWMGLRKFKPSISQIKKQINQYQTPVRLVYGQHDRIILPVRGEKFIKGIEAQAQLTVIASGHQVLHEKHAADISTAMLT